MDKTSTLRVINYFTGKLRKTNRKTYHAHELENNTAEMLITLKLNLRFNAQTHTWRFVVGFFLYRNRWNVSKIVHKCNKTSLAKMIFKNNLKDV